MAELPKYDDEMTKQTEEAAAAGEKLRYVGVVDVKAGTGAVELRRYKEDHPSRSSAAATTSSPSRPSDTPRDRPSSCADRAPARR